jgi:2'-5' RNA ligase
MAGSDRSELVIVALPSVSDPVRKVSSEKEAHLTLLYLGKPDYDVDQLVHIGEYIQYAASQLCAFGLEVTERGTLGPNDADVLFFDKKWSREIATFREHLLQDPLISAAYHSTEQYPEWTPHLTMGYPETPAQQDPQESGEFYSVRFDRISMWIDDSDGPTFQLKPYSYDMEVAMSQIKSPSTAMGELAHYGVKGMKWGVRRDDSGSSGGGSARVPAASADHKTAEASQRRIDAGGTRSLSNQELQGLINRMNLEKQYHTMVSQHPTELDNGINTVKKVLKVGKTVEDVRKFMGTPTGKAVKTGLKVAFTAAGAYATGGSSAAAKAGAGIVIRRAANHYTNTGN